MHELLADRVPLVGTILQWGPVGGDNPQFPGTVALLGLLLAGIGAVATVFGLRWLVDARSERGGEYQSAGQSDARHLSPLATVATGAVLLVAGLFLLFAGG